MAKVRDFGVLKWAEGAIADGRIGHLGFSFHDEYKIFQEIIDATINGHYVRSNIITWMKRHRPAHSV